MVYTVSPHVVTVVIGEAIRTLSWRVSHKWLKKIARRNFKVRLQLSAAGPRVSVCLLQRPWGSSR